MVQKEIQKLTLIINAVILVLVFALAGLFYLVGASFLIWFSIPTALVYIFGFYLIRKNKLDVYVRLVYGWLTLYMSITTVFLGYGFGFHLYSLSMIPIIFYTEYMAYKLGTTTINTKLYSGLVIAAYLISTGHAAYAKPVYETDTRIAGTFWIFNSLTVLAFVTFYSRLMISMIIKSERQLSDRANKDRLTNLYNRHYMMERLKEAHEDDAVYGIAMIDIDDFKSINDRYGHAAGDEVLISVARAIENTCKDCVVSRWGGEEFLVLMSSDTSILETLRTTVEAMTVTYEGNEIKLTLTAGFELKNKAITLDNWIAAADEKLYQGKNSGKNKVVV
ncbi:MAG: GGDEF domain-containing protein [Clostridiales bacterium]|nr:GGDEF domain-containing protein [Clostridiales bacterium]